MFNYSSIGKIFLQPHKCLRPDIGKPEERSVPMAHWIPLLSNRGASTIRESQSHLILSARSRHQWGAAPALVSRALQAPLHPHRHGSSLSFSRYCMDCQALHRKASSLISIHCFASHQNLRRDRTRSYLTYCRSTDI